MPTTSAERGKHGDQHKAKFFEERRIAVTEEALTKALAQLTLAQKAAAMCDQCLADELGAEIRKLTAMKMQISRGVLFKDAAAVPRREVR